MRVSLERNLSRLERPVHTAVSANAYKNGRAGYSLSSSERYQVICAELVLVLLKELEPLVAELVCSGEVLDRLRVVLAVLGVREARSVALQLYKGRIRIGACC